MFRIRYFIVIFINDTMIPEILSKCGRVQVLENCRKTSDFLSRRNE